MRPIRTEESKVRVAGFEGKKILKVFGYTLDRYVTSRVIIDGVNHPKGSPIRFKTIKSAANHIRNMKLEPPKKVNE